MCFSSILSRHSFWFVDRQLQSSQQLVLASNEIIFLLELSGSQLLQLAFPGSVCVFCHQLHSSLLQGNSSFCPMVAQILIGSPENIKRKKVFSSNSSFYYCYLYIRSWMHWDVALILQFCAIKLLWKKSVQQDDVIKRVLVEKVMEIWNLSFLY